MQKIPVALAKRHGTAKQCRGAQGAPAQARVLAW
jgi:hypothetical protein